MTDAIYRKESSWQFKHHLLSFFFIFFFLIQFLFFVHLSGSGIQSKKPFLFGSIEMQIKLVAGNSAGTVTAYYVSPLHKLNYKSCDQIQSSPSNSVRSWSWCVADVVDGEQARWDRLWVLGQCFRATLHHSHQCVRAGRRRQGAAVLPVVRSHCGFPQLHHTLEPQSDCVSSRLIVAKGRHLVWLTFFQKITTNIHYFHNTFSTYTLLYTRLMPVDPPEWYNFFYFCNPHVVFLSREVWMLKDT